MRHAALTSNSLLWLVIFLTLLLVMFLYAVIATPPEDAVRTEPPTLRPPAPPPPAPSAARPAGPQARVSPAGRHIAAPPPVISPPTASTGPRWGPVLASIVGIAGLAAGVIGGWLLLGARKAAVACPHHGVALCSQGFVVLTGLQLLGVAIAVAGITLVLAALFLALR
jgi:hypothetical protein